MGECINALAKKNEKYCNNSGYAFFPVPIFFPKMLSKCIDMLQDEITNCYLENNVEVVEKLIQVRINIIKMVNEGDLGENHTGLFLHDHPMLKNMDQLTIKKTPFYNFCVSVLKVANPYILLGIITRNEEGSLSEMNALVKNNLINIKGNFAKLHLIEEEMHGILSKEVATILSNHDFFRKDFLEGYILHDKLYNTILN